MAKINSVEEYINAKPQWREALKYLNDIISKTELKAEIKWGAPVYTLNSKNVVGLAGFKNHFGIWFFNGVFLKDEENVLVNAQETTKALRQMRFNSEDEIDEAIVLSYVKEAIANQKEGKEVKPTRKGKKVTLPEELKLALKLDKVLKENFESLTSGRQREYCEYISSAKRDATKQSRLEKIMPLILNGIGLNDKYKNC